MILTKVPLKSQINSNILSQVIDLLHYLKYTRQF